MTSLANQSYKLLVGDCPAATEAKSLAVCTADSPTGEPSAQMAQQLGEVSENGYLASLASERVTALQCAREQARALAKNPADQEVYVEDVTRKVGLLAEAHQEAYVLSRELVTLSRVPARRQDPEALSEKRELLRKAEARAAAIEASIPLRDLPSVRKTLQSQVSSLINQGRETNFTEALQTSFREKLRRALKDGETELDREIADLGKGVASNGQDLERNLRESLAQDTDLIESARHRLKTSDAELKSVACRVDAKYGRGAQYRDLGLSVGSIALGGAAAGALRAGSFAATSAVTGARVSGQLATGTAGILRGAAIAVESLVVLDEFRKACVAEQPRLSGATGKGGTCSGSVLQELDHDNCVLATVLAGLGARAASETVRSGVGAARALRGQADASRIVIPGTHRPERAIPLSGKGVDPLEVPSAGVTLRNTGDFEKYLQSSEYKDGTFVYMVVREPDGTDVLMLENRLPSAAQIQEGRYVTHRSLIQKYRDEHGGAEPMIVAGGEGTMNYRGEINKVINRMGSAYEGNDSPDYLVDVMQASGIRRTERSRVVTFDPRDGSKQDAGHEDAVTAIRREREILSLRPQAIDQIREVNRRMQLETPHLIYDDASVMDFGRLMIRARREGPPERQLATKYIYEYMSHLKEGTSFGVAKMVEKMKQDRVDVGETMDLVQRYLPEIVEEVRLKIPAPAR